MALMLETRRPFARTNGLEQADVEALKQARELLGNLHEDHELYCLLAEASREITWRDPLRSSGVLETVLQKLAHSNDSLIISRLVGNCCADNDENRAVVIRYIDNIIPSPDAVTKSHTIVLLYNLCHDWEPGQKKLASLGLASTWIELLSADETVHGGTESACASGLLLFVVQQKNDSDALTPVQIERLLSVASLYNDVVVFITLCEVVIAVLQDADIHQILAPPSTIRTFLSFLRKVADEKSSIVTQVRSLSSPIDDPTIDEGDLLGDLNTLRQTEQQIIGCLSDFSLSTNFTEANQFGGPIISLLRKAIISSSNNTISTCACLMLGNFSRSDSSCEVMLNESDTDVPFQSFQAALVKLMHTREDRALLHAVFGLLGNLARPNKNKLVLGRLGFISLAARFLKIDSLPQDSQIQVLRILRQLTSCGENLPRMISGDPDEERNSTPVSEGSESDHRCDVTPASDSPIEFIIQVFRKTDSAIVKEEAGRIVVALLRSIYSQDKIADDSPAIIESVFSSKELLYPIIFMLQHETSAGLRSEGLFGLALAARSPIGAVKVNAALDQPIWKLLENVAGSESSAKLPDSAGHQDQINLLVLASELLKNSGLAIEHSRAEELRALVKQLAVL